MKCISLSFVVGIQRMLFLSNKDKQEEEHEVVRYLHKETEKSVCKASQNEDRKERDGVPQMHLASSGNVLLQLWR